MEGKLNPKAVYKYPKGKLIYSENKAIESIAFILKGKVLVYNKGVKFSMGLGNFIGLHDMFLEKHQTTYMAMEEVILYVFPINRVEEIKGLLFDNNEYGGYMVASLCNYIKSLDQIYQLFIRHRANLFEFIKDNYNSYIEFTSRLGYSEKRFPEIEELELQEHDCELYEGEIEYYKECSQIPIDVMKEFYSYGNDMALYQINEQSQIINALIKSHDDLAKEVARMITYLAGGEKSLFYLITNLAIEVEEANKNSNHIVDKMDDILGQTNNIKKFYKSNVGGEKLNIDKKMIEGAYNFILSDTKGKDEVGQNSFIYSAEEVKRALSEMSGSYLKLLSYAGISTEDADLMMKNMTDFVNLRDRMSTDEDARVIRRNIIENYYIIYRKIFVKAYKEKNTPRIVEIFLRYGFADERLLSEKDLLTLYYLEEEKASETINVYNIKDWLTLIYEGKREPSKSEFDQDYRDSLLHMKRQGRITDKEFKQLESDRERKLQYEIENMFQTNNKLTNGQISTFVPVLHQDLIFKDFDKIFLSPANIEETIMELIKIDPMIFDREVIYSNPEKQIIREYIIKRVYPEIILMPTIGNRAVMWQDISSRKRDNPGRFILPVFFDENLKTALVKLFGEFRWEICRTIEGVYWNDITYKSLTSEYSDYLQFYNKNKKLSEAGKDKVKLQIQKGRRNSRNIFAMDYEQWVLYESRGAIKLNKVVREILATYCPFSREIREKLDRQPIFQELIRKFEINKTKKIRELEYRKRQLEREGIELTKELEKTMEYYKSL